MATNESIATVLELAILSIKETAPAIADILNVEPPQIDFFYRDKDYQRSQEMKALAAFFQRVHLALEGTDHVGSSNTKTTARRSNRTPVS